VSLLGQGLPRVSHFTFIGCRTKQRTRGLRGPMELCPGRG